MSKKQTPREPLGTVLQWQNASRMQNFYMRDYGKGREVAKRSRKHFLETALQDKKDGQMAGSVEKLINPSSEPELHS